MKRFVTACCLVLLTVTVCFGQSGQTAKYIRTGSSLPSTCSPNSGEVYFKTAATVGPYYCSATNTWSAMGAAASALSGSGVNTRLSFWSGTDTLSSASTLTWVSPLLTAPTLTLSSSTANAFLYSGTAGAVTATAAPTNGQLLIGSTGAAPVVAALSAGSNKVSVTNGAGSITLDVVPANLDVSGMTGTLAVANGGTGLTAFAKGTFPYASSANTLSALAIGTTGQFLTVSAGGVPSWTTGSAGFTVLSANSALDFGTTSAYTSSDLTIAVSGAVVGNPVMLGLPASPNANTCFTAWVSASDVVTVRFNNYSAGTINPASGTYYVKVIQ